MSNNLDKEQRLNEWYSHIHDYVGNTERNRRREREHSTLLRELISKLDKYIGNNSSLKGNSKYHR